MKFKKILACVCSLCLFCGTYSAVPDFGNNMSVSAAEEQTYDVLTYVNYGDYIEITDCDYEASGDLIIPESIDGVPVTSIGSWAFSSCTSLASLTIPDSVTFIGDWNFSGCTNLYSIKVTETNENYCSISGVLFDKNATKLIKYPAGKMDDEYYIPDSVTSIGRGAFSDCTSLASVTIPDCVTSIGNSAFSGCTNLSSITIPDGVENIEGYAFNKCKSLESITIPDGVINIENGTFYLCDRLESVTIPDSVTSIGDDAFYYCESLISVIIPNSVTRIGKRTFEECKSLVSITIPDSVTSIRERAFGECIHLESITIENPECKIYCIIPQTATIYGCENSTAQANAKENGNKFLPITTETQTYEMLQYVNYGDYIEITGCDGKASGDLIIPESIDGVPVTSIGNWAFSLCNRLESVTIPDSVTNIGDWAFNRCISLASLNIPDSVKSIGNKAFESCRSLESITINNPECNISFANIPQSATIYGHENSTAQKYAEKYGNKFISITPEIPVYEILEYVNYGDYIEITDCDETVAIDLIIPESIDGVPVKSIGNDAFLSCERLTSVTIPDSVTSIGDNAFRYCVSLSSVIIPDSVTSIGEDAFYYCTSLASVTIPDSVTSIGKFAFYRCASLTSITIPDSVTSVGGSAFEDCESLASITIPNSVTSIECSAFRECTSLTSVTIPDSVTSINQCAFANCTSLESITINNSECDIENCVHKVSAGDWDENIPQSAAIYGYENSTAQTYAEENGNKFVPITSELIYGDADGSGEVTLADAVSIVSYIADSERYPLASYDAADVCNRGDGINTSDAISVQNLLLGKITSLPESVMPL